MTLKNIITAMALTTMSITANAQAQLGSGLELGNLDTKVKPADDFYQYACGGWMEKHPLPAAYSRYSSFDALGEENKKRINVTIDREDNKYTAIRSIRTEEA